MLLFRYLGTQILYQVWDFISGWYIGSFLLVFRAMSRFFAGLDRSIALKISLQHLFVPMFGDKTISGHILGFIFRVIRITIGLVMYVFGFVLFLAMYLIWAAIPILVILWGFYPNII